ncbi:MAG TPA: methionyl-tRNA formyltransferase [Candidatus Angelobacter sp.]|nr:methionyl-tRNA formyltransferase [Candidatus Angelobacter sp.]
MALVRKLVEQKLDKNSAHSDVECTYSIVDEKFLQIDTYGSADRKIPGKKSQTIRFTPEAIKQLKILLRNHF